MITVEAYRKGKLIASCPAESEQEASRKTAALVRLLGLDILTEWRRDRQAWNRTLGLTVPKQYP